VKSTPSSSNRVLIVDDNRSIHEGFRKILGAQPTNTGLDAMEQELFGTKLVQSPGCPNLELDSANQGQEALAMVERALAEGRPYAMAFIDGRMPPGWDGIETAQRIWEADADLQIVICTAHCDYSRHEMLRALGYSDKLLILKKPFDDIEVLQLATALTAKWQLTRQARRHVEELEKTVQHRTAQLIRSEDRYRLITENAGDLIAIVDEDAGWIYRSPSFQRLLGYSAEEIARLSILDLIHSDDQPAASRVVHDCATRRQKMTAEFRLRHNDGQWLTMETHASPFHDATGAVEGTLLVTRDISERHKLELQLRQAQKLESIGQLAAGIAHEINTPMQFIGDNMRFLQETFTDLVPLLTSYRDLLVAVENNSVTPAIIATARAANIAAAPDYLCQEIPRAIQDTLEGVKRTTRIVQAMKTFSHPGSAEKVAVDLRDAIESTLTISRSEWKHVAKIVTDFDPELAEVPLLAAEFNQALLNLVVNAAHAITDALGPRSRSQGTITITTRRVDSWAEVRVSDTGTGIPEAVQRRIFDPFFTTKPPGKGTGQGLAIARSVVVEKHRGSLEFETAVGKGTTFIIRVPLEGAPATVAGTVPAHHAVAIT
jgi:PAS domain S-box-containing protein